MSAKGPQPRGVYSGKVSRIAGPGCFVELAGPWGINEGVVYAAQGLVMQGQEVWVKVVSANGQRVVLSMSDVDQRTGREVVAYTGGVFASVESSQVFSSRPPSSRLGLGSRHGNLRKRILEEIEDDGCHVEQVEVELKEAKPEFLRQQHTALVEVIEEPVEFDQEKPKFIKPSTDKLHAFGRKGSSKEVEKQASSSSIAKKPPDKPQKNHPSHREIAANARVKRPRVQFKRDREVNPAILKQRQGLPIYGLREKLLEAVRENQVLLVIGETGSGKSTQITQFLAEEGYTSNGMIGCTQPRRIAATSVAKRVAEEFGCRLGEEVGYAIRFEDITSSQTVIKYMTDGMLLREILMDRNLSSYSVVMLDEVHERTVDTDVLLGLLKDLLRRRPEFRLIVTSATLDADKFSQYFFGCVTFHIPGRTFPVEVIHSKLPEPDYLAASVSTVLGIHVREPEGDILLFLTGQEEIETTCQALQEKMRALGPGLPTLVILPAYSALPAESLSKIFDPTPPGRRKVVVATNIAEASLTIDGIYYVVDSGYVKEHRYNAKLGLDSLVICPISQASAKQRAGRAGRTGPGVCYRLYPENTLQSEMLPSTVPEIQRTNLGSTVLNLKAILREDDIFSFDFLDRPADHALSSAMEQLYSLGALDDGGHITKLGLKMVEFPMEPLLSRMLLASVELGCSDEIITIISMLQAQSVFYRPLDKQSEADRKKARFFQSGGDCLTLLAVYESWKASGFAAGWCHSNFVRVEALQRAHDVRKELLSTMEDKGLAVVSAGSDNSKIRKGICAGLFYHAARRDPEGGYRTLVGNQRVFIHPGSSLAHRGSPKWVVYQELLMTSKEFMQGVTSIESSWLIELAPRIFQTASSSKRRKLERLEPLSGAKTNAARRNRFHIN
ncbi:probable pre-mRNA-splicing factor ATP-dependent RNA helicase DEAH5 [Selaginella moellendorffii]|uniref:probable pre-mRNA-splicing factor ATP-dependent RNA helicase DEAH5 n=1 Tax=Selaginella moellendorffii TaxID=88036 RepID=UPI000D1CE480|nr:probable pre-mRNA-splicing factor ATP-dependent RNA helicase DEAH5 [Selaginella moellendorffii]|eukprot:XP_024537428.1 probable pre-mRNA-splicing factor ATP-dependent RNA helicase DEAH5 [Selaginella moellendorffii]